MALVLNLHLKHVTFTILIIVSETIPENTSVHSPDLPPIAGSSLAISIRNQPKINTIFPVIGWRYLVNDKNCELEVCTWLPSSADIAFFINSNLTDPELAGE